MHIFILTLGTRGDFELFLMLGRELRRRGHHVVMGTSEFYAPGTREAGIEWARIGNGSLDEMVSILRSLSPVQDRTQRTYLYYSRWLRPQLSISRNQITSIAAGADYFISNLKMVLQRGDRILPGAFVTYDPPGDITDLAKYGSQNHEGRILEVVAMNKKLADPQDLWGEQYHFTGFWRDEQAAAWVAPLSLRAFLDAGPAPVVVTMGSMAMFDTRKFLGDVNQALRQCGQRGIVVGGWSGITEPDSPGGSVQCVTEAPYEWLFPKTSCIIHHGGCGTVAAVLRAGKPSILIPQITCQEHFARMLAEERLATGIFDAHTLNPADLAAAIQKAVTDEQYTQSARNWQKVVSEERGVEAAADSIEAHWHRIPRD
ncbi:MAG TPA: glycosyltransferase [Candidatus Methylomirabilis sp.]|nr:glycosyltransferase [Candidatus Methylomirabilis sp.]